MLLGIVAVVDATLCCEMASRSAKVRKCRLGLVIDVRIKAE